MIYDVQAIQVVHKDKLPPVKHYRPKPKKMAKSLLKTWQQEFGLTGILNTRSRVWKELESRVALAIETALEMQQVVNLNTKRKKR